MSSELTEVADAIRSVGASAGPVVSDVAAARQRASALVGRVPPGAPSASAAISSLEQAISHLNGAREQLAKFSQLAERVAQRLVIGDGPESLALTSPPVGYLRAGDSHAAAWRTKEGVRRLTFQECESHADDLLNGRIVNKELGANGSALDLDGERYIRPTPTLARLLESDVRAAGLSDIEGYVGRINPLYYAGKEWRRNCGPCARAFADTYQGVETRVAPGDHEPGEYKEMLDATTWTDPKVLTPDRSRDSSPAGFTARAWEAVRSGAKDLPDGTVLIIGVGWAEGGGHWFNAVVDGGSLKWVDPQNGRVGPWPPGYTSLISRVQAVQRPTGRSAWKGMDL